MEAPKLNTARRFRKSILFFSKLTLLTLLMITLLYSWFFFYPEATYDNKGNYLVVFSYMIVMCTFSNVYNAFRVGVLRLVEIIYSLILSVAMSNLIMYLQFCLIARQLLSPWPILLATCVQIALSFFGGMQLNRIYFMLYPARNVVVVCSTAQSISEDVIEKLKRSKERYRVCDVVDEAEGFEAITARIGGHNAVMLCDISPELRKRLINYCFICRKRVYITLGVEDVLINNAHSTQLFDTPTLYFKSTGPTTEQLIMKRAFDLLFSGILLVLSSPIMLITAICIKAYDGGPVLFKQKRYTIDNRIFEVYKFRSMIVDAEKNGAQLSTKQDSRITPIGKWIRKVRLDELPQLFNILMGDMSVVGPRPERPEMAEQYGLPEFGLRTRMKAGLTGYAQIYGKYNTSPQDKLTMDLIYMEKYSFLLDLKLIFMTVKILFMPESTEGLDTQAHESRVAVLSAPESKN